MTQQHPHYDAKPTVNAAGRGVDTPAPEPPWWANERRVIQLLAIFGAVITIVGAGYLVSLVADLDYITPAMRVGAAVLLGAVLLAAGLVLHRRGVLPIVSSGILITSAVTFAFVLYAVMFIYHWSPPRITMAVFALIVAGFFAVTRMWNASNTTIWLGYIFSVFFIQYAHSATEFLFVPGGIIGVFMYAAGFRHRSWTNPRYHACAIVGLGLLAAELPTTTNNSFSATFILVTAAAVVLLATWDHTHTPRTWLYCSGVFPAVMIGVSWVVARDHLWLLWVSFALCVGWVALTYFVPNRQLPQTAYIHVIAWCVTATALVAIFALDTQRTVATVVTVMGLAFTLYWFTIHQLSEIVWGWWVTVVLIVTIPIAASAALPNNHFYPAWQEALVAVVIFGYLAVTAWRARAVAQLPVWVRYCVLLLALHLQVLAVAVLGKTLAGSYGFNTAHALSTIAWVAVGVWLIAWPTRIPHPWSIKLAAVMIVAAGVKMINVDGTVLPLLLSSVEYLCIGALLLIATARRSKQAHKPATAPNGSPR